MHCLTSNQTMMHIARKAGMEIQREYGEADAYLRLLPANPASMLRLFMRPPSEVIVEVLAADVISTAP